MHKQHFEIFFVKQEKWRKKVGLVLAKRKKYTPEELLRRSIMMK